MKRYQRLFCLCALLSLFAFGCGREEGETVPEQPGETPPQQQEQKPEREEAPVLTELPTGEQWMEYKQNHGDQARAEYKEQLYQLLDRQDLQQISDGLKRELEDWAGGLEETPFLQVELECSQDPLLMWSGGDKRQYRNVTAAVRLFYDSSAQPEAQGQQMELLLEQAQQILRQSPYALKLVSAELVFVDRQTGYPQYSADQVSVGLPGEEDPSAPIPPEEQKLQTLAYQAVSDFCRREFSGSPFDSLPYANMTLSRFGAAEGSPVLECQVRIQQSKEGDPQQFAQQLEQLARRMAGQWMEEKEALAALGLTQGKITFDLQDSPDGPLVYELSLTAE